MFKAAELSQDLSILSVVFGVLQPKENNNKKPVILMLMQVCFLLHGHKRFVTNGRKSHFFRLTHSTKL